VGADEQADVPGVKVVTAGPRMALYAKERRRTLPPLRFGLGVLVHLLRHGREYDGGQWASFPYFSLLAAGPRAAGAGTASSSSGAGAVPPRARARVLLLAAPEDRLRAWAFAAS